MPPNPLEVTHRNSNGKVTYVAVDQEPNGRGVEFEGGAEDCDGVQMEQTAEEMTALTDGDVEEMKLDENGEPLLPGPRPYVPKPGESIVIGTTHPWEGLRMFNRTGGLTNQNGMNMLITALFIVGETAGGGLVAMPTALANAGFLVGIITIIVTAILTCSTGIMLAENWTILQLRWPQYRHHCGKPYAAMGLHAVGETTSKVVSYVLNVTQFGTAAVFLLLAARNLESAVRYFFIVTISYCVLVVCTAFCVFPLTLLGSPKDFWIPVLVAMFTTSGAVILLLLGITLDRPHCAAVAQLAPFTYTSVFMGFGTVMFAYGGHGAFPTIHHDMKEPRQFRSSVIIAFFVISCFYMPVSVIGAMTYGNSLHDSIIMSIQNVHIQQAINLLITLHVTLALTIVFNPMNQDLEQALKLPNRFSAKRVMARGCMMALVVLVAISFPTFGPLLDLVGGSTITMMALIFPPYFNLMLNTKLRKFGPTPISNIEPITWRDVYRYNSWRKLTLNITVMLCGLCGGIAASVSAINALATTQFSPPCYEAYLPDAIRFWDSTPGAHADIVDEDSLAKFFCCGPGRNVSALGADVCFDPAVFRSSGGHG